MPTAQTIDQLLPETPSGSDQRSTADDHLREIKRALKNTFAQLVGATDVTKEDLDNLINATAEVVASALVMRLASGEISGDITGNANTASTLETARTIAGQSFNGSANITISIQDLVGISGVDSITINKLAGLATVLGDNSLADALNNLDGGVSGIPKFADLTDKDSTDKVTSPNYVATQLDFLSALQTTLANAGKIIRFDSLGAISLVDAPIFKTISQGVGSQSLVLPSDFASYDILHFSTTGNSDLDVCHQSVLTNVLSTDIKWNVTNGSIGGQTNRGVQFTYVASSRTITVSISGANFLAAKLFRGAG